MFETIDPGLHYDDHHHYPHREAYIEPIHHYDYENPHHYENVDDHEPYEVAYNEIDEEEENVAEYDWLHQQLLQ